MYILVINCGSSSLKYQLINITNKQVFAKGLVEKIGNANNSKGKLTHECKLNNELLKTTIEEIFPDHETAFEYISDLLTKGKNSVIRKKADITGIGHRVVHGGSKHINTEKITKKLKETLKTLTPLAPLHNPANIVGIEAAEKIFPKAVQYAVFDTAFHKTLPEYAYLYAISKRYFTKNQIRVYGFHGISHEYVYQEAKKYFKKRNLKAISLHLGNGASITAINSKGESIDTTMGMGPVAGLMMGTRSGDIDPTVIFYMAEKLNLPLSEIKNILSKKSGMLSIGGSNDARDIKNLYKKKDKNAILCYQMYTYRIKKYIGAYLSILNGADCIIFTAGLGENDILTRELSCKDLEYLGIILDKSKNKKYNHPEKPVEIQAKNSKIKILIIPTNEEMHIALEAKKILNSVSRETNNRVYLSSKSLIFLL